MFITAPLRTRERPETVTLGGSDAEDTPTHALVVQLISGSMVGGGGEEHAPNTHRLNPQERLVSTAAIKSI